MHPASEQSREGTRVSHPQTGAGSGTMALCSPGCSPFPRGAFHTNPGPSPHSQCPAQLSLMSKEQENFVQTTQAVTAEEGVRSNLGENNCCAQRQLKQAKQQQCRDCSLSSEQVSLCQKLLLSASMCCAMEFGHQCLNRLRFLAQTETLS